MSRTLSTAARQAIFAPETSKVFLMLLTINHSDMAGPVRVVNNYENITSNGNLFTAYPFLFRLPSEDEDTLAQVELQITNIDRLLVDSVRSISSPFTVTLDIALSDTPDTIEAGPFAMNMREVKYDAMKLTGTCNFQDILNEAYPAGSYTPADYPGLF